jgi:heme exporter protein D
MDPGGDFAMSEFFAMGKYAFYVWTSYGLVLGIVILNVIWARRSLQRALAEARRRLAMRGDNA